MIDFKIEDHLQISSVKKEDKNGKPISSERRLKLKTLQVKLPGKDWARIKTTSGNKYFSSSAKANDAIHKFMEKRIGPERTFNHIHWRTLIQ